MLERLQQRIRRAARSWTRAPSRERPIILMYHRIAESGADPWELCVAPSRFKLHLELLRRSYHTISMDQLVTALERRAVPHNAVAITFDDGYRDNAVLAKPLLEQAGIPATFFLTTGAIGSGRPFWWDELWELVCAGPSRASLTLNVAGDTVNLQWTDDPATSAHSKAWRADIEPQTDKQRAYIQLWRKLQVLTPLSREQALDALREQVGQRARPAWSDLDLPMSLEDARGLASKCISVGGHARTHHPLVRFGAERRWQEIAGSRTDVANQTGELPTGFAYPHGNWDNQTRAQVVEAGYSWAVTTHRAAVMPAEFDPFALPRLAVGDWTADRLRHEMEKLRA